MIMNRLSFTLACLFTLSWASATAQDVPQDTKPAAAPDDPQLAKLLAEGAGALLTEADRRHTAWQDQHLIVSMTTDKGRHLELAIYSKGTDRRAILFNEPADLRDMRIVVKGTDEIYAKIPGNRKARRVAGHSRKQNLAGTQWDLDIGSLIRLAPFYDPKITGQDAQHITLELTKKAGCAINYPTAMIKVVRKSLTVDHLSYRDENGAVVKTEDRSDLTRRGESYTYQKIRLFNTQTKAFTDIQVTKIENNKGIKDSMFKRRWLERGM